MTAAHFEDAKQEADAAELGVWLLVVSELLLFAGLFAIYVYTRAAYPDAFAAGIHHMSRALGTTNTFVLLTSSLSAALAGAAMKANRRGLALACIGFTLLCGLAFLGIKSIEYRGHLHEGMGPTMFAAAAEAGGMPRATALFFSLYWLMTGLHAAHVVGGMGGFLWAAHRVHRRTITAERPHPLELVTVYWHFVDLVWIFLWPAFYLTATIR